MAIDNRELTFTITADGAKALVDAIAHSLTTHALDKAGERRAEDLMSYIKIRLESLPELPNEKQPKLKL